MPPWNHYRKKYSLESEDLPNPHLPTVVVIEGIESEDYTDQETGNLETRHQILLAGYGYPLRLNNKKIETLQSLLGDNTEDAIGRKVALIVVMENIYGKNQPRIAIHPHPVNDNVPPTPVPFKLATKSPTRLAIAHSYGVAVEPPAPALPAGHGARPAAPPSVTASGTRLGPDAAAELVMLLRERNRTWEWLVGHFKANAMGALVEGLTPPDADTACRGPAWNVLKALPVTAGIANRDAEKSKLIASWVPPGVNHNTGEVNPDDIPF